MIPCPFGKKGETREKGRKKEKRRKRERKKKDNWDQSRGMVGKKGKWEAKKDYFVVKILGSSSNWERDFKIHGTIDTPDIFLSEHRFYSSSG